MWHPDGTNRISCRAVRACRRPRTTSAVSRLARTASPPRAVLPPDKCQSARRSAAFRTCPIAPRRSGPPFPPGAETSLTLADDVRRRRSLARWREEKRWSSALVGVRSSFPLVLTALESPVSLSLLHNRTPPVARTTEEPRFYSLSSTGMPLDPTGQSPFCLEIDEHAMSVYGDRARVCGRVCCS